MALFVPKKIPQIPLFNIHYNTALYLCMYGDNYTLHLILVHVRWQLYDCLCDSESDNGSQCLF